jgi:hypothetical protein
MKTIMEILVISGATLVLLVVALIRFIRLMSDIEEIEDADGNSKG